MAGEFSMVGLLGRRGPASGDLTETLVIFARAERLWRGWVSRIRATSGNVHAMFYDNRPTGLAKA
jgi:hypothetical protein